MLERHCTLGTPSALLLAHLGPLRPRPAPADHTAQCQLGGTREPVVQLALAIDYATAVPTVLCGVAYAAQLGADLPTSAVAYAVAAVACFVGGCVPAGPRGFMLVHGAWHVFSALAGNELALAHASQALAQ